MSIASLTRLLVKNLPDPGLAGVRQEGRHGGRAVISLDGVVGNGAPALSASRSGREMTLVLLKQEASF